ncbi:uncharacterized protein LOC135165340 [Diachasmimorpha longicaudata]|uniref:uncharacterized protein LOC135165340 n=1 Tax=Diachasmimorpha longicaudata TaxID=58733 RepID=UPI0030B89DD3
MKAEVTLLIVTIFLAWAVARSPPKPGCTETECPGPLRYYNDLGCQPVKTNPEDCCAEKYNCDHLESRSDDKCYAFGREYSHGEQLKQEEGSCLPECTCSKMGDEKATWACASILLPAPAPEGCYRPRNASMCWDGPDTCPPNADDIAKCEVDGNVLRDGDYFEPTSDPNLGCWCGPGYEGKNVAPFCKDMRQQKCGLELNNNWELENNCAPVWNVGQDGRTHCNFMWRCQKDGDVVNPREVEMGTPETITPDPEGMTCKIGNLVLRRGDILGQKSPDTLDCIRCICDVPPVATCLKLPMDACYITAEDLADSHEKKA